MVRPKRKSFVPRLRENRERLGLTQESVAERLGMTPEMVRRHEKGQSLPREDYRQGYAELYERSQAELGLFEGSARRSPSPITLPEPLPLPSARPAPNIEKLNDADLSEIRTYLGDLVALDNQVGGTELVKPAGRFFRLLRHQIGRGLYVPASRKDLLASAGELAEIAGWLAFDADDHELVRRMNHEALYFSRLVGDKSIELLTLQNASMHSASTRQAGEGVDIAESVLEGHYRLTPRLRALFLVRKARALSLLGDESALALLAEARSLYSDGLQPDDPAWTWWIDDSELYGHEAICRINLGDTDRSLTFFEQSVDTIPPGHNRGQYLLRAFLLQAQVEANSWEQASRTVRDLQRLAIPVSSNRADRIVVSAITRLDESVGVKVPGELRDEAQQLRYLLLEAS